MNYQPKTIRTFIGAKNYTESREFYRALGFEEVELNETMCLFKVTEALGFYLQDYYVRKWVNNSMVFLEVDDIDVCAEELLSKGLHNKYKYVRLIPGQYTVDTYETLLFGGFSPDRLFLQRNG